MPLDNGPPFDNQILWPQFSSFSLSSFFVKLQVNDLECNADLCMIYLKVSSELYVE